MKVAINCDLKCKTYFWNTNTLSLSEKQIHPESVSTAFGCLLLLIKLLVWITDCVPRTLYTLSHLILSITERIGKNSSIQFSSITQSCPTLCNPMNHSMPGLPVHHQLPEFIQTHVHWVGDAIQPSHPLSSPSPPALNPSQHQGLFKWVSSLHQVAKVLEFQFQHQSYQWTPRTHLL